MGVALPLMEAFYTLQGEGFHQGKAAYFIRLAGCDVGCHWCDVKESWEAGVHDVVDIRRIAAVASVHPARLAVITGGEPTMYNLDPLTEELQQSGFKTHIETSGAHPLSGKWDWICLSPKKFKKPERGIIPKADELKVVIFNKSDFEWAETYATEVRDDCMLYLQPEWSRAETMIPQIIHYIKEHPKWRISLQAHKFMQIP